MLFSQRTLDRKLKLSRFERFATHEELDRDEAEVGRVRDDAAEEGAFDETGGELGRADWEDARANLTKGQE